YWARQQGRAVRCDGDRLGSVVMATLPLRRLKSSLNVRIDCMCGQLSAPIVLALLSREQHEVIERSGAAEDVPIISLNCAIRIDSKPGAVCDLDRVRRADVFGAAIKDWIGPLTYVVVGGFCAGDFRHEFYTKLIGSSACLMGNDVVLDDDRT